MSSTRDIQAKRRQQELEALQSRHQARLVREAAFNTDYIERTKRAREASGRTLPEVAKMLGFAAKTTYQRYEKTSPLPLYLAEEFCRLTGADLFEFLTGRPNPIGLIRPPAAAVAPSEQAAPADRGGGRARRGARSSRK